MRTLLTTIAAILIAAQPPAAAVAQPRVPQPLGEGTSAIRGILTDALTKAPVAGCEVQLRVTEMSAMQTGAVTTGADGVYEFAGITDGNYFLMIHCPSHLTTCFRAGESEPASCAPITLLKDQQRSDLHVRLTPGAVVRGRVLDPDGQPMGDVQITIAVLVGDGFRNTQASAVRADGSFNIVVPAGRIRVMAQPRPKIVGSEPRLRRFVTHPPVYFPGVFDEVDGWPIDIKAGEIVELDFHMPPLPIGSIKAVVTGPDGYSLDHVRALRPEANQIKNLTVVDHGVGYVEGLREGRYIVVARGRSADGPLAAWEIVHMTAGEVPVTLDLKPTARVYGRVMPDRDGLPPLAGVRVVAAWTDGAIDLDPLGRDEGEVTADGSFSIDGVFGMRMVRVAGLDPAWQVRAVRYGRTDITASGIDVLPGTTIEIAILVSRR